MPKSRDEISKDLDLLRYLDMQKFREALQEAGAHLPSEEEFIKEMDLHLRIIYLRHTTTRVETEPKSLNRGDMSREVRMLIKPPFYAFGNKVFMPKKGMFSVWNKEKYSPKCEPEAEPEVIQAFTEFTAAQRLMPFATKRDLIRESIPSSLQHRMAAYRHVRFYFQKDGAGRITNLATDKDNPVDIMISQNANGIIGFNEGCIEVDVNVLSDSLCWLDRELMAGIVYFDKDVGDIRKGPALEIADAHGTHVIIYDRRSKKKAKGA